MNQCKFDEVDVFLKLGNPQDVFHFTHCDECKQKIQTLHPILQELREKNKKKMRQVEAS